MKNFIRIMKALADPGRVLIVKMLAAREMCVCELTAALGLAQPTVSRHLGVLENAGLVESRRNGPWVDYRIAAAATGHAAAMLEIVRNSLGHDPEVKKALARAATVDRSQVCGRSP